MSWNWSLLSHFHPDGYYFIDDFVITTATNCRVDADDETPSDAAAPRNIYFCDILLMLLSLRLCCRLWLSMQVLHSDLFSFAREVDDDFHDDDGHCSVRCCGWWSRYCRGFPLLFVHVDAVACGAIAHNALDARRDICAAMFMSCARRFVIMSCFLSLTGSGKDGFSSDNSVRIWDVSTQQQVAVLTGHTLRVTAVAFDVSGKYLASGDLMMTFKWWSWRCCCCCFSCRWCCLRWWLQWRYGWCWWWW